MGGIGLRHAPPEPDNFEIEPGTLRTQPSNALHHFNLQRRDFFKVMGAGIAIFTVTANAVTAQESGGHHQNRDQDQPKDISSWLHISDDGMVTVFTGKVEVGQNTRTTLLLNPLPTNCAFRLPAFEWSWEIPRFTPFDMGTFGSRSTPYMSPLLRRAASAARDLLLAQAAAEWKTAADKLQANEGKITNPATGAAFSYAQLARGKALAHDLPEADPITPPTKWDRSRKTGAQAGRARIRHRPASVHARSASCRSPLWKSVAAFLVRSKARFG